MDRSEFPYFIRTIMNFRIYRKYVKLFQEEDNEFNRKWLYQLNRDIRIKGFNLGVENFEIYYEGVQSIDRRRIRRYLQNIGENLESSNVEESSL